MVVVDYKIIDSLFGMMGNVDQFIQDIKNNNSMKYLKYYILSVQMDNFLYGWVFIVKGRYYNYIYFFEV